MTIIAAADGSALGNPGPAGWAWYVDDNCWRAGGWPHGTNNMGELMAVLDLFKSTAHVPEEPLHILCDSQYVINSVTKWMPGWKRKGWRKSDGKPVLNLELLKEIDAALVGRKYTFEWVKGHAGHDLNEAADDRARDAATAYQAKRTPKSGPGFPGAQSSEAAQTASGSQTASVTLSSAASQKDDAGTSGSLQSAPAPVRDLVPAAFGESALFGDQDQPDLFSVLDDEPDPSFAPGPATGIDAVIEQERELLDPQVRSDPFRVAELLHPDFEEIGSSGRVWTRAETIQMLSEAQSAAIDMEVMALTQLDTSTALLRYRSSSQGRSVLRSSLWSLDGKAWRLRFHQGTLEA
ncbi:RNase H family protein [Arthrobacter sp. N199823]|uniref:RNase H family protein n=1 Tax=Arthrobacter sp. N199823 TaxID=2058895 RepID=UPI000CE38A5F|nr:RNase H family protein [Arthrobacter sp. N199823]